LPEIVKPVDIFFDLLNLSVLVCHCFSSFSALIELRLLLPDASPTDHGPTCTNYFCIFSLCDRAVADQLNFISLTAI
jgi:hypothetical protein